MNQYRASIEYNAHTLKMLGKVQNQSRVLHNVIYISACVALIISGINFGSATPLGMFLMACGGVAIPLLNSVNNAAINKMIEALGNSSVHVGYHFEKDHFTCNTGKESTCFTYDSLVKLWEDKDHFYIFPNKNQAFMISKKTLQPLDTDTFRSMISEESGLKWQNSMSIFRLSFNVSDILFKIKGCI